MSLFRERRAQLDERGGSLPLTYNFRSRSELLEVVNAVFAERFPDMAELTAGREDTGGHDGRPAVELLLTDADGWEEREELAERIAAGLPPAQSWRQAEARLLAQRVGELVRSGRARAGEIVVLLRASGDLEVFERALQLRGLRTLAAVGAFWGHQQIGDLVTYLRALANPLDEQALYGVLASPLGGCSRDGLALLARAAQASRGGVWEVAKRAVASGGDSGGGDDAAARLLARIDPQDRSALAAAVELLERERAGAARRTIASLIERAIDASGYRDHVLGLDWGERRLANVHKLLRLARALRGERGARPAGVPRPGRVPAGRREDRAGRPGRGRRAGRRSPDDGARGEGPRVPGRVRGRPRPPAERAHARPARRRRAHRPAPDAPGRRRLEPGARLTTSCAPSAASAKPKRRTGSSTSR